ncbi:MAG: DUF134 domain-containing protein [Chlamydiota bacterium]
MPRPRCLRRVCCIPGVTYFKPAGIPLRILEEVVVTLDEVEALRLADLDGLYQEDAAKRMQISRPTFSRLIESAHRKVAEALVKGKALRMEGGPIQMKGGITMPGRDGTGPVVKGQGLGMGPCGCGQRRQFGRGRGAGWGRGSRRGPASGEKPVSTAGAEQKEEKSEGRKE